MLYGVWSHGWTEIGICFAFLNYPTVVYLHQGALEGAYALLGKEVVVVNAKYFCGDQDYPYIYTDILPEPLIKMEPYHIEDFLCINKNNLKNESK